MDGKKNGAINSTNGHVSNGDIHSSKEEPKLSCLQKISHKIISVLETAFYRYLFLGIPMTHNSVNDKYTCVSKY